MNASKQEISDVLRQRKIEYLERQLANDHGDYNISDRSRAHFQTLVYKIDTIPAYLATDWISQHPGAKVVTKLRMGDYVDGTWLADRKLSTQSQNHKCTL